MNVQWSKAALRDMRRIGDRTMTDRIVGAVDAFANTGYGDVRKLQGYANEYRLRVGKWRVRFTIDEGELIVLRALPRGGAYTSRL